MGFHCPCNKFRNVPEDAWYWNPQSEEFKSGKPEYAKVKPLDLMTFGYMHKLGKCRTMRSKAHVKAKEDPSAICLLVPLPKGTKGLHHNRVSAVAGRSGWCAKCP